jgi:myosin-crossreactive antigen
MENVQDRLEIKNRVLALKQKIETLPSSLAEELKLEYALIEDYMRDKFFRSNFRAKKVEGKKIGGTYLVD